MTFAEQQYRAHLERQKRLGKAQPVRRSGARASAAPPQATPGPFAPPAPDADREQGGPIEKMRREIAELSSLLKAVVREDQTRLVLPSRPKLVVSAVAAFYRVSLNDLVSTRRERKLIRPRHVAMYLAKELTGHSLPAIGRLLARDHTTVHQACRNIAKQRLEDAKLEAELRELTAQFAQEEPQ